jgi:transglutaminase-like putative cysteine protease
MSPLLLPLCASAVLGLLGPNGGEVALGETRVYKVRQTAVLDQIPEGSKSVRFWVAVPEDERYQDVLDFAVVSAPGPWRLEREPDRGNRFLYVEVAEPKTAALEVVVEFTLRREPVLTEVDPKQVGPITEVHRRVYAEDLSWDAPHMKVTPAIAEMAAEACAGETNPAAQVRKLLDFVAASADHYSKDPTKPKCGIGDAEDCLTNGGGCCTDLHSLFIALARAQGIPARLQMGYRVLEKNEGKEVDPGYRCWVEYFLPGYGFVSADIVEADAVDGQGPGRWFTGLTERRLWLNSGREFHLNPRQAQAGRVNTMIIGHAEIDGVPARVLPDGPLAAQLTRKVHFTEVRGESSTRVGAAASSGR